jgi:hypothetical protein
MYYGERIKLSNMLTRAQGLVDFFFFFDENIWAGKFLNSRQKDFETLGWPEETSVI